MSETPHHQRHVNSAIAYDVWQHHMVTGDTGFLRFTGAEMLIEIARFWSSLTTFDAAEGRYEITGVMGPDEYHETYPGSDEPGLRNDTYTIVMAVWVMQRALETLDVLPPHYREELVQELTTRDEEIERWRDISRKMKVVFHADGVLTQFEGYEELPEFDWEGYRERYGNTQRLDRLLEAEGDSTDRYKLAEQADVLMLLFDVPGGTTAEGIHLGAMAGTVDIVLRCLTGMRALGPVLRLDPALPTEVKKLRFSVHYRGQRVHVELAEDRITPAVRPGGTTPVHLLVHGQPVELAPGQERELALERTP